MKRKTIFAVLAVLLVFFVASCNRESTQGRMPESIREALDNPPEGVLVGRGIAREATPEMSRTLANIRARAEIVSRHESSVRFTTNSISQDDTSISFSQTIDLLSLASASEAGFNLLGDVQGGQFKFRRSDRVVDDENRQIVESFTSTELVDLQGFLLLRDDSLAYEHDPNSLREIVVGLDRLGSCWDFIEGVSGEYYWEVIEDMDEQGNYWVVVIRHTR